MVPLIKQLRWLPRWACMFLPTKQKKIVAWIDLVRFGLVFSFFFCFLFLNKARSNNANAGNEREQTEAYTLFEHRLYIYKNTTYIYKTIAQTMFFSSFMQNSRMYFSLPFVWCIGLKFLYFCNKTFSEIRFRWIYANFFPIQIRIKIFFLRDSVTIYV